MEEPIKIEFTRNYNNSENNYLYEDFPNEDLNHRGSDMEEIFTKKMGRRLGRISHAGYKEGYFWSAIQGEVNDKTIGRIREEYFKKGLRDSIFRQFNSEGKIIYDTTFKKGTGLWKEFHGNGKLYFEAFTKDGYFTDTLKLYNDKGILSEKLLYRKDSLIYREKMIFDENPTDNKN